MNSRHDRDRPLIVAIHGLGRQVRSEKRNIFLVSKVEIKENLAL
jgi:hypothetical protein